MKEIKITEGKVGEALAQIDVLEWLNLKDKGCLRLLAEEMFSVCRELLDVEELDFEIKWETKRCILRVSTEALVSDDAKKEFLSMSSNCENMANKGVKGMFAAVLEMFMFGAGTNYHDETLSYGMYSPGLEYNNVWMLSQYMEKAPIEEVKDQWDGMEKSIIANFADDVSIGVRSGKVEITVTKNI